MAYVPNTGHIDMTAEAVEGLAREAKEQGVALEDFLGGIAKVVGKILKEDVARKDPAYAEALRAAISMRLFDEHGGDLGEFRGNHKRLH